MRVFLLSGQQMAEQNSAPSTLPVVPTKQSDSNSPLRSAIRLQFGL